MDHTTDVTHKGEFFEYFGLTCTFSPNETLTSQGPNLMISSVILYVHVCVHVNILTSVSVCVCEHNTLSRESCSILVSHGTVLVC